MKTDLRIMKLMSNLLFDAPIHVEHGFESQDSEYDDTSVDGGGCVTKRDEQNISDTIVFGRIVRSEGNQRPKSQSE